MCAVSFWVLKVAYGWPTPSAGTKVRSGCVVTRPGGNFLGDQNCWWMDVHPPNNSMDFIGNMSSYDCHWHYHDLSWFNWCWFPYPVQRTACNSNSPQTWHIQPKLHANDVAECRCFTRRDGSSTLVGLESKTLRSLVRLVVMDSQQLECVQASPLRNQFCIKDYLREHTIFQHISTLFAWNSTYFNTDRSRLLQDWTPALDPRVVEALSVLLKPYSKGKTGKKHWRIIVGCQCSQGKPALNSCKGSRYISIYCRSQGKHIRQGTQMAWHYTFKRHQKALRIRITEKDWKDEIQSVSHSLNISKDLHHLQPTFEMAELALGPTRGSPKELHSEATLG